MTAETRTTAESERYTPEWWNSAPLQRMIFEGPHDGATVGYHGQTLLMPAPQSLPGYFPNMHEAVVMQSLPVAEYAIGRVAPGHGEIVAAYRYVGTR